MKHVISISLGSSNRNHRSITTFQNENILLERMGTDGDMKKAIEMIQDLDGKVDAFGMGGITFKLVAAGKDYYFRDAKRFTRNAFKTPIVDGSGLKNTLERSVIHHLNKNGIPLQNKKVLLVSSVDRFGMVETFSELGSQMILGDLMFGLGLNLPIRTLTTINQISKMALPFLTRLPFQWLYPTGEKQDQQVVRFENHYQWADIIAGDYLYIKRHMPSQLNNKIIITNTVTSSDIKELKSRKVALLITSTPNFDGRSFGTNVMEAMIIAVSGQKPEQMTPSDYHHWIDKLEWKPRIEILNEPSK